MTGRNIVQLGESAREREREPGGGSLLAFAINPVACWPALAEAETGIGVLQISIKPAGLGVPFVLSGVASCTAGGQCEGGNRAT